MDAGKRGSVYPVREGSRPGRSFFGGAADSLETGHGQARSPGSEAKAVSCGPDRS